MSWVERAPATRARGPPAASGRGRAPAPGEKSARRSCPPSRSPVERGGGGVRKESLRAGPVDARRAEPSGSRREARVGAQAGLEGGGGALGDPFHGLCDEEGLQARLGLSRVGGGCRVGAQGS